MELFTLVLAIITICFLIMGVRVWIKGEFTNGEIGANPELRKKGLMCAKEEELRLLHQAQGKDGFADCASCSTCCGGSPSPETCQ